MATEPRNFNLRHPERHIGEVFVGNLDEKQYRELPYATKRRGERAYTMRGVRYRNIQPAFVLRAEIEEHPDGKELIWLLFRNGLWVLRYNYNRTHPELREGEIFLCNETRQGFARITWTTKRLGERACGTTGFPIGSVWPVFLKRIELQNSSIGQNVLKTLLREGVV